MRASSSLVCPRLSPAGRLPSCPQPGPPSQSIQVHAAAQHCCSSTYFVLPSVPLCPSALPLCATISPFVPLCAPLLPLAVQLQCPATHLQPPVLIFSPEDPHAQLLCHPLDLPLCATLCHPSAAACRAASPHNPSLPLHLPPSCTTHLQPPVAHLLPDLLHSLAGLDPLLLEQAHPQLLAAVPAGQVAQHVVIVVPGRGEGGALG